MNKEDVKEMDQKIRKIITIYSGLHPKSNVEWLRQEMKEVVGCKHRGLCQWWKEKLSIICYQK